MTFCLPSLQVQLQASR